MNIINVVNIFLIYHLYKLKSNKKKILLHELEKEAPV